MPVHIHEDLLPLFSAVVGAPVQADGTSPTANSNKALTDALALLNTNYTTVLGTATTALNNAATANSGVSSLNTQVANLATTASVTNLTTRVTAAEGGLATVTGTVNNATTGLAAVKSIADTNTTNIGTTNGNVTSLTTRVGTAETGLSTVTSAVNNATTGLAATNALAAGRATVASVTAVQTNVDTLSSAVNNGTTGLAATNTLANTASANASTALTNAAGALTQANLRVLKAGDTSTGNQVVPAAVAMDQAVTLFQLSGGIFTPSRTFQNVGATPVSADPASAPVAAITNPFVTIPAQSGLKYNILRIYLTTITAPTLASTISLGSNAAADNAFSMLVALTTVPIVGKTLELLSLTGTALPAALTLPITLQAKCVGGGGVFRIVIEGRLL